MALLFANFIFAADRAEAVAVLSPALFLALLFLGRTCWQQWPCVCEQKNKE